MADVFSLDKLSIKKLKALAGRNNVSLRGCFEKSDIIKTLRDAGAKEHSGSAAGDVLVERGDAEACPAVQRHRARPGVHVCLFFADAVGSEAAVEGGRPASFIYLSAEASKI